MVLNPRELREMMDVASKIKAKQLIHAAQTKPNKELSSTQNKSETRTITWTKHTHHHTTNTSIAIGNNHAIQNFQNPTHNTYPHRLRRLTPHKAQNRRERGLCYRCDEKWNLTHQCKNNELSIVLVSDEDRAEKEVKVENALQGIELSLNSVVGLAEPRTLWSYAQFLMTELVEKLKLPTPKHQSMML